MTPYTGDPTDTAEHERQAEIKDLDAKRKRHQELDDIRWLMTHPQGRRIVRRLLDMTGPRRTPYHSHGAQMAFNAGMQNVGLFIEGEVLEATPEGYIKLLRETK